jgi:uncharacterized protein (TIGR03067 family)
VVNGKDDPSPRGTWSVTLKDGKYTSKVGDEGTVKVDPTTTPKSQDITPSGGDFKGKSSLAIYEVKGNTLRVCWAPPGKPRPEAFECKKGSGHALYTYKRAKP